ncbi:MAG: oxidoreductase [Promethearchaeota archaeon]
MESMESVFSPLSFNGTEIMNRLVAQPMERSAGTLEGKLTPELIGEYANLAKGQWGVLNVEAMTVTGKNRSRKGQLVLNHETSGMVGRLLDEMRKESPRTKIIMQLTFPGVIAGAGLEKTTIIPSVHEMDPSIRLLTDDDIREIQDDFRRAIDICMEVKADGIDIKGCHGYLAGEFLRPSNTRPGQFGGSFENRTRFFKELFQHATTRIREEGAVGFLLGSRVSISECMKGGFGTSGPEAYIEDLTEPKRFASLLHEWGANFFNVSAGIPALMPEVTRPSKTVPWGIYNHFRLTKEIKDHLVGEGRDMIVIGSAYTMLGRELVTYANKNIEDGTVDLVGLGRQNLADPLYPVKMMRGQHDSVNYCIGCNLCAKLLVMQRHVGCVHYNQKFKTILGDT